MHERTNQMTETPLTFRRYEDGDREAVWAVVAAKTAQLGFTTGPWDEDMRSIPHTYLASGGEFIVGELGGGLVAHASPRRLTRRPAPRSRRRPRVPRAMPSTRKVARTRQGGRI